MSNLFEILRRAVRCRGANEVVVLLAVACGGEMERKLRVCVEAAPPPTPIDRWKLPERSATRVA